MVGRIASMVIGWIDPRVTRRPSNSTKKASSSCPRYQSSRFSRCEALPVLECSTRCSLNIWIAANSRSTQSYQKITAWREHTSPPRTAYPCCQICRQCQERFHQSIYGGTTSMHGLLLHESQTLRARSKRDSFIASLNLIRRPQWQHLGSTCQVSYKSSA